MLPHFVALSLLCMVIGDGAVNPSASITTGEMKGHIEFLASDELEGRDSGFRGGELAARYIETRFSAAGLKPLRESYRMPFDLGTSTAVSRAKLTFGATMLESGSNLASASYSASCDAHGKACAANELDVTGCIVVVVGGDQPAKARETADELAAKGAAGVVFVSERDRLRTEGDFRRRADPREKDQQEGDGGGALFEAVARARAPALAIPVVRVSSSFAEALSDAVDAGADVKIHVERSPGFNIVGWREGSDPVLKSEYVVIGAHYDHVGMDAKGRIWNGADDNASGTAAVLEFADALAQIPDGPAAPRRSIVVITWSGEERGLLGSRAFASSEPISFEKIAAYVNLDMIGRNDNKSIDVGQACQELFDRCVELGAGYGLTIGTADPVYMSASDTLSFVDADVPTIFFFSGLHTEYHTPADQIELVDFDKAARVARLACDIVLEVANRDTRPEFTVPVRKSAPPDSGRKLGVILDEDAASDGLKIRSVSDESIAKRAGIKAGDTLVKVAGLAVKSRTELRKALDTPKDGEAFVLEVVREGETISLSATFGLPETREM